jgi:hypothetical protein
MAEGRKYELDELLIRPGTYFNPQTEVMVVVDDSPSLDQEIFNLEAFEGADWILVDDDIPVDEAARDELFQRFQTVHGGADGRDFEDLDDDEPDELEEELKPDPDPDDL